MIRSRATRRARVALSVGLAITVGGCSTCELTTGCVEAAPASTLALGPLLDQRPPAGAGVVILGDSLTDQSREAIAAELPAAVIDAFGGRTVARVVAADTGLERVAELKQQRPEWWVVALGTNDGANAVLPIDDIRIDVTRLLDAIGRDECVLWVLPSVSAPLSAARQKGADDFSLVAAEEVGKLSCHSLLFWSETILAMPEVLGPDGEHFTDAGELRFARAISEALVRARGTA